MKIICSGADLSEAASKVLRAASAKGLSPILEGIKLATDGSFLVLTATDSELSIQTRIVSSTLVEGATVVPGKIFCEFVKKLVANQIEISVDTNNRMHLKYQDNVGQLACMSVSEYPDIYQLSSSQEFVIIKSEFKDLINKVEFCCSSDDSRPILKGVYLDIDDHSITAVALDGYRLAKSVKAVEKTTSKFNAVVPKKSLTEMVRLIDDSTEPLKVQIQKNYIMVDLGHTKITSRLLEGEFINYKQIIPTSSNSTVIVGKEQMEDSLERAGLLAKVDKSNLVKFDISGNTLEVSCNSDMGNISEKLNVKLDGVEIKVAFNGNYFIALLKVLHTQNIVIKFINATSPAVILPGGSSDDTMFLVLPVRLN
ncbi:MAG: DNA polymerase III subunit beta [Clostridiales bacterium]|jgi:DNA polymerase-3 subunit beta|nr:DNA polymerase III subunit beta [Clostridiales bacterium]